MQLSNTFSEQVQLAVTMVQKGCAVWVTERGGYSKLLWQMTESLECLVVQKAWFLQQVGTL
jgi:hypothetical protein